jgi:hypothetical protein
MSALFVGSRVCFDPHWPMLPRCRELGTTGVDQVGKIIGINRNPTGLSHWDSAVIAWDNGERSPVNLGNLVLAEEVS